MRYLFLGGRLCPAHENRKDNLLNRVYDRIRSSLDEAVAYARADVGSVFPPRDEADVAAYDPDEVVKGYVDWREGDAMPGPNHSPGYRWGCMNRRKDITKEDDGYERIRHAYFTSRQRNDTLGDGS